MRGSGQLSCLQRPQYTELLRLTAAGTGDALVVLFIMKEQATHQKFTEPHLGHLIRETRGPPTPLTTPKNTK